MANNLTAQVAQIGAAGAIIFTHNPAVFAAYEARVAQLYVQFPRIAGTTPDGWHTPDINRAARNALMPTPVVLLPPPPPQPHPAFNDDLWNWTPTVKWANESGMEDDDD